MPKSPESFSSEEKKPEYGIEGSQIWPENFSEGKLLEWKNKIMEDAENPISDARLVLLEMLAIQTYKNREGEKERAEGNFNKHIRMLGEGLYSYFEETGLNNEQSYSAAEMFAEAIKDVLPKGHSLRNPRVGDVLDSPWMSYGMSKGNASVKKVKSWALYNQKKYCVEKASVE